MFNMIITSIFGGVAVGCICWSAGSGNLPVGIISGLCSAICIFSYMYFSCRKMKAQVLERNKLIKQIQEHNKSALNDFKKWLNEQVKKIDHISEVQDQLNEILNPAEDEVGEISGIKGILLHLCTIKNSSDSVDSILSSNNTELLNIKGIIDSGKDDYSKIAGGLQENSEKLGEVCKSVENFNKEYSELLKKLTSEQNRMLAVQRENCELLRVVGDKFRGEKQK